jgi:mRNA-degrading endonuclease RelE of RelBE toxin-antitoxin system
MKNNNTFVQNNGMEIQEGIVYRSHVGDLVKVLSINNDTNTVKIYNVSDSCHTWCRIDSAIKDNKFRSQI